MQIPQTLIELRQAQQLLAAEAKQLREQGRVALAISVEREARQAQERFDSAALAYRKLGLL